YVGGDSVFIALWDADIINAQDYYPFGMLLPNRVYQADSTGTGDYRYAFNGKEQDPEWDGNGNMYDYGFRIYNPRIGKFLSVDPLTSSYPWYTPYQFAGNTPIAAIDLDGLEEFIVVKEFTAASDGTTQVLTNTTEREVGWELWGKEIVGYEFMLNGKTYTANSDQTTFGRDGLGEKPGQEGNFSGVHSLTKEELTQLFVYGFNSINKYESIDDAYLNESVGEEAELDFKFTLYKVLDIEENMLIEIDGVTYNPNEAGNFLWAALNEYADEVTDLTALYDPSFAAQIITIIDDLRLDEKWEQKALDDGENYGIDLSDDSEFNQAVYEAIENAQMFDDSYVTKLRNDDTRKEDE
ncbi:MAG: RHS repeat-associated core domain-containing protein, partial [Bacteroidetes bacterium]|nr:RHS repeat-associated core domain-containing protein [Bacteroidota bacterium]